MHLVGDANIIFEDHRPDHTTTEHIVLPPTPHASGTPYTMSYNER